MELKPYTKKELVNLYGVSKFVMSKWLKQIEDEIGKSSGRYYTIKQIELIFKNLGIPGQVLQNT